MDTYLDEAFGKFSPLNLMCDVQINLSSENNEMPSEHEFDKLLLKKRRALIDTSERLIKSEKIIFLDTLKKELNGEYVGIREHFINKIRPEDLFETFPEFKSIGEFNLTPEQLNTIEEKYSLYPYFKKLLIELLRTVEQLQTEFEKPKQIKTETKTDKLKVKQIALIHVYEGIQITRDNAGEIAAQHGYTAKNSGEGLFQDYTNYCSMANRKGKPTLCTPKKLKNKIELFESVVNHLSDNTKQRAIDEINILKTIFENEYQ